MAKSTPAVRAATAERKRRATNQADDLRRTREAHARETAEDYLEAIADLSAALGEARVIDLARRLGVTHVTVNRTIARLRTAGYVTAKPYRAIFLTDQGRQMADEARRRHEVVVRFLVAIGVPEGAALRDAEGIEHHVSPETLAAFERRLQRGF
ncbi:manganese-binding transcriptional regulator MntR [Nibricoccus sp. IMCC34717]|uniref:manganese-binding transcriptional regulator MntR n=1 Tax=Nibricoccus sp. IMCC34717 TaxID=3034021 RepID=UPI00384F8401